MPFADTQAMNEHLAEIAKTVVPGAHAVIVLDGAGWHGSKALCTPDNITLLPLPPYAPELNPIENVWAYLRANKLAISIFDSYDHIVEKCCRRARRERRGSKALCTPDNITLLPLPPYAPELNPIENVWAYLRANKLAISIFDAVEKCCDAWNFFAEDEETVQNITSREYAKSVIL